MFQNIRHLYLVCLSKHVVWHKEIDRHTFLSLDTYANTSDTSPVKQDTEGQYEGW